MKYLYKLSSKHKYYQYVVLLFLATQLLPPLNYYVRIPDDYLHGLLFLLTAALFPSIAQKKEMMWLYVYLLVAFMFFLFGNAFYGGIGAVTGPLCYIGAALLLTEYAIKYDYDYKFTRNVVFLMILSNVFMTFISIPTIMVIPNILRYLYNSDTKDNYVEYSRWLISYNTCHGLVLLFPALLFLCRKFFKQNKKMFVFWLLSTLTLLIIVYLSNATTALIVSIMIIFLSFYIRSEKLDGRAIAMFVIAGLFAVALSSNAIMIPILDFVQSNMDETWSNYSKIDDIKQGMLYGESSGDVENRRVLYEQSVTLFIDSPIWGTNHPEKIGHHSWIVDRLACLGVLFFIPIFFFLKYHIEAVYKHLNHAKVLYILGVFAFIILLFAKNDFVQGTWLYGLAFLPLLCRYVDYVVKNK